MMGLFRIINHIWDTPVNQL